MSDLVHTSMYLYIHVTWCDVQANSKQLTGCVRLDINLLKPSRIEFAQDPAPSLSLQDGRQTTPKWLEYVYRTSHPVLRWLPTKLAEWIGENLQDELGFSDKADERAEPGTGWTPAELNHILQAHVVDGCALREEDSLRPAVTKQAQMMSSTTWFSSAPLRS